MSALPYAWAKAQRILLRDGVLTVCPSTPGWSISEARRQFGATTIQRVRDDELDGLLTAAYADTGSAAAVVGAAENEVDLDRLMQDMPEIAAVYHRSVIQHHDTVCHAGNGIQVM